MKPAGFGYYPRSPGRRDPRQSGRRHDPHGPIRGGDSPPHQHVALRCGRRIDRGRVAGRETARQEEGLRLPPNIRLVGSSQFQIQLGPSVRTSIDTTPDVFFFDPIR